MVSGPNSSERDTERDAFTHLDSDQSEAAVQAAVLQSGLAALKAKQYAAAIAHLESLSGVETSSANRYKAQMGLVRAYASKGEAARAIALCRQLSQSNRRQVRAWATQTLNELTQKFPQASPEKSVEPAPDFVPESSPDPQSSVSSAADIASQPALRSENAAQISPTQDLTGFTPLSEESHQNSRENASTPDLSGFTPLDSTPTPISPKAPRTSPNPSGFVTWRESAEYQQTSDVESEETLADLPSTDKPSPVSASNPTELTQLESASETDDHSVDTPPEQIQWRNAGRLDRLRSLGRVKQWRFRLALGGTAIALFWLVRFLVHGTMESINRLLVWIRWPINFQPIQFLYKDPSGTVIVFLVALVILSPWIFDLLLKLFYGLQPFSTRSLTHYSPEAVRILRRVCQQRGWFLPQLKLLPIQAPLCFTYGCLPRYARIVVSQGLLDQLAEDEIATLYAYELGHLGRRWDWLLMSGLGLLLQLLHLVYWQAAAWGDRQTRPLLRNLAVGSSAVSYGVYWLIRKVGLWLSRLRTYYSDRTAVELTGNPNGLTRALLKIAMGYTQSIQQQGYTHPLIESIDLLTPLGFQTSLHLGGAIAQPEKALAWDLQNPYRHWLTLNNAHPLTGDRIHLLNLYARYWKLDTELDLGSNPSSRSKIRFKSLPEFSNYWRPLLLQGSPFFGLPAGWAIAMLFWGLGIFATWMNWWRLDWLYQDSSIVQGSLVLGLGIGVMLRINPFFPDLKPATWQTYPNLEKLLANPQAMPTDGLGIKTQGKLLGRSGIANWLGQDLILQTRSGLIKLHFLSQFGPIGNLLTKQSRPVDLVGHTLQVIGWFRRGATGWIDVDQFQAPGNKVIHSNHPVWSTLLSLMACLWGLYIIYTGAG